MTKKTFRYFKPLCNNITILPFPKRLLECLPGQVLRSLLTCTEYSEDGTRFCFLTTNKKLKDSIKLSKGLCRFLDDTDNADPLKARIFENNKEAFQDGHAVVGSILDVSSIDIEDLLQLLAKNEVERAFLLFWSYTPHQPDAEPAFRWEAWITAERVDRTTQCSLRAAQNERLQSNLQ